MFVLHLVSSAGLCRYAEHVYCLRLISSVVSGWKNTVIASEHVRLRFTEALAAEHSRLGTQHAIA